MVSQDDVDIMIDAMQIFCYEPGADIIRQGCNAKLPFIYFVSYYCFYFVAFVLNKLFHI